MSEAQFQLAQVNIARMLAPLDDPLMADFVANLDPINALADGAPGFVWRLQGEGNDATSLRPYEDDRIIVNMSVWRDLDALRQFVFRSDHVYIMRRRREWFERMAEVFTALWWIPAGHRPTVEEAKARLLSLQQYGDTPYAFSFRAAFPAPNGAPHTAPTSFSDACPAT